MLNKCICSPKFPIIIVILSCSIFFRLIFSAIELVEDLQNKLEKKEFEIAKQYYTIRDYKSAIKSIENFIADNPGSMYREEALYFKWLAQYEIAINSIETRINERVTELERSLNSFLNNYPDTIFLEDLSKKINIAKQLL